MDFALEVKNLSVSYSNTDAINDLSLTIKKGEFVNIIGPNGGGKTTFVTSVLGLIKPNTGQITILGKDIKKGKKYIGYVPQNASVEKDFPITVLETVETALLNSGLNPFKKFTQNQKETALTFLKTLGMDSLAKRQINELSGGEFQRLLIARALAKNPEILILDEPCANIDPPTAELIYSLLNEINQKGCTVIMVSHDISYILKSQKRTVCIHRGLCFDGMPTDDLFYHI